MADEDLEYDGRARRRPPGANSTVIEIFDLLDSHPEGMTAEEITDALRLGFPTDAYRAFERRLVQKRSARQTKGGSNPGLPPPPLKFGTPEFKSHAENWWVKGALKGMARHGTAQRIDDHWFRTDRAPKIYIVCEAGHGHYVEYDSKKGRAEDEARVRRAHIREEARKVLSEPRLAKNARKVIEQLLEIS